MILESTLERKRKGQSQVVQKKPGGTLISSWVVRAVGMRQLKEHVTMGSRNALEIEKKRK